MNKNFGLFLLNVSVAVYLFATGIMGLSGKTYSPGGGEIQNTVKALFNGSNIAGIIAAILAVCAIAAGIFILFKFFGINIPVNEPLLAILALVWVVFIIMLDIIHPISGGKFTMDWFRDIGAHLMVLAGILMATKRFGG
ncbi:MAG: hypothetical protein LBH43_03020 [Treponema sp.]|jgi:hypothetical protein|nr:hypothetical protein [Treponema sp.]